MKKIFVALLSFTLVFSLSACDNSEKDAYARAYKEAKIENFLAHKNEESHLIVFRVNPDGPEPWGTDSDDEFFSLLTELEYVEINTDSLKSVKHNYHVNRDRYTSLYVYSTQTTVGVNYTIDGHLFLVNVQRFYKVAEEDFSNLILVMERIISANI